MQPSPCYQPQQPGLLPAAVSAELARLEARLGQAADQWARCQLAELGDAAAGRVLRKVAEAATVRNLSAFIMFFAKQETMERNAAGIPTAKSAPCCSLGPSRATSRGRCQSRSLPPGHCGGNVFPFSFWSWSLELLFACSSVSLSVVKQRVLPAVSAAFLSFVPLVPFWDENGSSPFWGRSS